MSLQRTNRFFWFNLLDVNVDDNNGEVTHEDIVLFNGRELTDITSNRIQGTLDDHFHNFPQVVALHSAYASALQMELDLNTARQYPDVPIIEKEVVAATDSTWSLGFAQAILTSSVAHDEHNILWLLPWLPSIPNYTYLMVVLDAGTVPTQEYLLALLCWILKTISLRSAVGVHQGALISLYGAHMYYHITLSTSLIWIFQGGTYTTDKTFLIDGRWHPTLLAYSSTFQVMGVSAATFQYVSALQLTRRLQPGSSSKAQETICFEPGLIFICKYVLPLEFCIVRV